MMGRTHATSGAVAFLALAPALDTYGIVPATPVTIVAGTLAAAGAALLPDLDHEHATVAQSLGFVTRSLTKIVSKISGGHRNGTHSLLGAVLFTALSWQASVSPVATAIILGWGSQRYGSSMSVARR